MRTASGFDVENPGEVLLGFVHEWYPMYDGVEVPQDNELRIAEIALSVMLNSRISGNTAGAIWTEARAGVESALAEIEPSIDLLDVPVGVPIPSERAISLAITEMCGVHRCSLSTATKVLHQKRPGLIPIFDSVVERQYLPYCPTDRNRTWGDFAIALIHLVHQDLLSVEEEIRALRNAMKENGTPLTGSRILNILMWAVGTKRDESLRRLAVR